MSGALSRLEGAVPERLADWRGVIADYCDLTKPRIIMLLLITTAAAMSMAARGLPRLDLFVWTMLGGALAAGSAGTFNCIIDRDVDRLMRRTMTRPLATGRIAPAHAMLFASVLGLVGFCVLYVLVNPLAAFLSLAGNVYYVLIYTLWLKRATPMNIVIGGAAGAVPPLVGWAAITHGIGGPAWGLFAIIFLWTPPHFWALALMANTDYHKARIPMLPNVAGVDYTKKQILGYTIVLVLASLALYPLHIMGALYFAAAGILGGIFIFDAARLLGDAGATWSRRTFKYSLLYLALMCLVMVIDRVI